ncbi:MULTISPECIES: 1-deoxy-D-xylulose-5-phosphate synthase N-terminal domain-containing protein [Acidiphilium]|uniref:1-deoxy-D-xylulose-5-phosphate synthase N-terminal domain-containing protein n=1 Tax=Acidiphilium TaxID=522 RepID=UPI000BD44B7A|nr:MULTISPECIES: 1-deoxy-D-xylulose-5-phosphate synthase N-terminal domain-containing protein [Acidiphilium]OZB26658.1 MAG: transketolase [Acidiphilium sp. 34-64-41]HQT85262.1 1-deoxy-D-xylulose-5-phosphate synthase N-terminal domain-containing protein [Acidiphilium rubrum]
MDKFVADQLRDASASAPTADYAALRQIERKLLWLSSWMIHNANHIRPNRDGLKVGGHQASCASVVSIMTALYFHMLRPQDRVAVKPHAGPVLHAINYLLGRQTVDMMQGLRQVGGAQAYPSRVKDGGEIDFSTGSVGLGVAITSFAGLIQDYLRAHDMTPTDRPASRHVAIAGDAELDEGNIYEALLEGWKHDVRDVWWVVDYNRQSLDSVMPDRLFGRFEGLFRDMGWNVMSLKYGKALEAAFRKPGGAALRAWIDDCPNSLYSALTFQGGAAWRQALVADLGRSRGVRAIIDPVSDDALALLMTNLAGHDLPTLIEAFTEAAHSDQPTCFLAYTTKGAGLPFAGHKDNHSGLMNEDQMDAFRTLMNIREGHEWDPYEGIAAPETLRHFVASVPFAAKLSPAGRVLSAPLVPVPATLPHAPSAGRKMSTQGAFGEMLSEIGRGEGDCADLAKHIVTMSPDVTVSTSLGPWVNRRGVFDRHTRNDVFRDAKLASAQRWGMSPEGQHIELGIAEQNLFLLLAAAGLAGPMQGTRLLPIGTVYDPFVNRGHDALVYGCYQDARFMLVATPSGITLAPEGGQHQSTNTPLLGMVQDRIAAYEPAYADEFAILFRHGFDWMQRPEGSSVWFRLSTRQLDQPHRTIDPAAVIAGAHWIKPPIPGAGIAILYQGAVAPEAEAAFAALLEDAPDAGLMAITSPDRLFANWRAAQTARREGRHDTPSHIETLLAPLAPGAALVTVLDGHPSTHAWLGGVRGQRIHTLGPDHFGQSGDIPDLYRIYGIDEDAILNACAAAMLTP